MSIEKIFNSYIAARSSKEFSDEIFVERMRRVGDEIIISFSFTSNLNIIKKEFVDEGLLSRACNILKKVVKTDEWIDMKVGTGDAEKLSDIMNDMFIKDYFDEIVKEYIIEFQNDFSSWYDLYENKYDEFYFEKPEPVFTLVLSDEYVEDLFPARYLEFLRVV